MGFFQSLGDFENPAWWVKQTVRGSNNPTDPVAHPPTQLTSLNGAIYDAKSRDQASRLYGGDYSSYGGTIDQAYQNLGQPLHDSSDRTPVVGAATTHLANAFADRVLQKTGKLPTDDQVRQFVAKNLTPGFAEKVIQNQINPDQLTSLADQHILQNPEITAAPDTSAADSQNRILGLNKQLQDIYDVSSGQLKSDINDSYGETKQNVANDLAGQGLLTQPTSRLSLDKLEGSKQKSLGQGLASLKAQQASGQVDLGKTVENMLAGERRAGEAGTQFRQGLGLQRDVFNAGQEQNAFSNRLGQQQLGLAEKIGKMQADANKPGWMDYLNTAFKGAGTAAQVATAFA